LTVHREKKELPVYGLLVTKEGLKAEMRKAPKDV